MAFLKVKTRGNRHTLRWSLEDFLTASFGDWGKGRVQGRNAQAAAMHMSVGTVSYMRAVTCGAALARQSNLLARLYLLCKMNPPLVVGLREAWDETSQKLVVLQEKGEWQVMVVKHTLVILWESTDGGAPSLLKIPVVPGLIKYGVIIFCFWVWVREFSLEFRV